MQKKEYEDDVLMLGGHPFHSRFILGPRHIRVHVG